MRLHAVTSRPMMSKYDPWVNMLRTTVAAFAAGVGGADSVTVLPFDSPLGRPDALRPPDRAQHLAPAHRRVPRRPRRRPGRRLVRRREAHRRPGPRRLGGLRPPRRRRRPGRTRSPQTVAKREAEIAKRKRPITGLTEFPNLDEVLPEREPTDEWDGVRRYGASFEALRDEPADDPGLPGHARHRRPAHRPRDLRHQPARGRWHRGPRRATHDGQRVVCLAGTDAAYDE